MSRWLLMGLVGLVACGDAQQAPPGVDVPAVDRATGAVARGDELRRGCSSFTQALAQQDAAEVYDPQRSVLEVAVGTQRFLLSSAVAECRANPVAATRLRFAEAEPQEGVRHVLDTHCGVISTTIGGVLWLADPPLSDDGNPPAGWDENRTGGVFRQRDEGHGWFLADSGVRALLAKAATGAADAGSGCE